MKANKEESKFKKLQYILFIKPTNQVFLQLFRYTFVGGAAFLVDFGLLYFFTEVFHFHYLLSASLSFIAGLIVNYVISKLWVFQKSVIRNKGIEFLLFGMIGVVGLGFTDLFMWLFTDCLELYYMISKIITTAIVYFWNFFARKYLLFNKK